MKRTVKLNTSFLISKKIRVINTLIEIRCNYQIHTYLLGQAISKEFGGSK